MADANHTNLKTCYRCKLSKPREQYQKHGQMRDGLQPCCKTCCAEDARMRKAGIAPNRKKGQRWDGNRPPLTPEFLREVFSYDPDTGELRWKERPAQHFHVPGWADFWNRRHTGLIAGKADDNGYTRVTLRGKPRLAHRLIWAIVYGEEPEQIDHINGNPSDNRLCNLRACTHPQNQQNQRLQKNNKSGYKGVSWSAKHQKWRASITVDRTHRHLGLFLEPLDAYRAYCAAADAAYGEFANHG